MLTRVPHTCLHIPSFLFDSHRHPILHTLYNNSTAPPLLNLTFNPETTNDPFLQIRFQTKPTSSIPMKKLKLGGFRLDLKIFTSFKWILRHRRKPARLPNPVTGIISLARHLRPGVKTLSCSDSGPGYIQLGKEKPVELVPKGHLAVYFGEAGGEARRAVVPVVYANHPLFGELLKEAERVYGYNQAGRITIPCGYSEFEKVKMRIAAWDHCHPGRSSS